jgi:hypothetical protein
LSPHLKDPALQAKSQAWFTHWAVALGGAEHGAHEGPHALAFSAVPAWHALPHAKNPLLH